MHVYYTIVYQNLPSSIIVVKASWKCNLKKENKCRSMLETFIGLNAPFDQLYIFPQVNLSYQNQETGRRGELTEGWGAQ